MRALLRSALGLLLGVVAQLWLATLRLRVVAHPDLAQHGDVPWVLSFFHGAQWPLLAWKRRRPTLVMVSHSADGAIQSRALGLLGFRVVRGSSSRGGARGLAAIVRGLRRGDVDAAFAVDGPRGPYGAPKPGAALAAQRSGGVLVPMGSAVASGMTLARAWDRFVLAWPFARVVVVLGAPIDVRAMTSGDAIVALRNGILGAQTTALTTLAEIMRNSPKLQGVLDATQPVSGRLSPKLNGLGTPPVKPRASFTGDRTDHA
jgi:lysophospholipid acyltransferase (LPLAT)-like uncharacterized protein